MFRIKVLTVIVFAVVGFISCSDPNAKQFEIASSKTYEASLFRQHCAICHGPEGNGKTLDDGKIVPSLRAGEFKAKTEKQIYNQIAEGGNGMTPFRSQLTERELSQMTLFVLHELRGQ